ncbi:MAG: glycoside hydrolase family 92 protein, partial [Actinomycetota bacterium]|nr:glycoside hydrolase family 92 protein [Actinomycetota bacterium]
YTVGSPLIEKATITPVGGTAITVEAPGASAAGKYVQAATLGGASLDRPWFTHDQLVDAGNVSFTMGALPNTGWGSAGAAAPPSMSSTAMSSDSLESFGCPRLEAPEPVATALTYTGDTRARGEQVTLAARLTTSDGTPLVGRPITFEIAGQTLSATTDDSGVATLVATVPDHGRSQEVLVQFAGDEGHRPSDTTATIHWGGGRA